MQKESRSRYLFKNTAVFAIGNFVSKFLSFFLVPLYTNFLTTSEYGTIDLLTVLCTLVVPLITFNISEAVMRFSLDKNSNHDSIISIGIFTLIISTFLSLFAIPILNFFPALKEYSILFAIFLLSFAYSQFFLCVLRGKEQLVLYSIGNIIHALLIGILNVIFLTIFKMGVKGYFLAYIISNVIVFIFSFIVSKTFRHIKFFRLEKKLFKEMFLYSTLLIPNSFMWWIMNSLDKIMITSMLGTTANGIYSISYKIPSLLSSVTTIFNQAWSYSAIREKESEDKEEYNNHIFSNLFKVVIIISVFLLLILKPFLKIYVGNDFFDSWKYTTFLIVGFVFMTLGSFLSTCYTVHKDSIGFLKSAIVGAIINLVLNFILIEKIKIYGAALSTAISYFCVFIYRLFDTKKYVKFNIKKTEYFIGILVLLLSACTVYINDNISYLLLLIQNLIILCMYKNFWLNLLKKVLNKLKKDNN